MKTKLVVGYSTNRDDAFMRKFSKHICKSSGLSKNKEEIMVLPFYNDGSVSLTAAYNMIWNMAVNGDMGADSVFVFIHHDIHFKTDNWGRTLLNIFNNEVVDILGLAGTDTLREHCMWWSDEENTLSKKNLWGRVWHKLDKKAPVLSVFTNPNTPCAKVQPVVAVDGVFLAFDPVQCHQFDEDFTGFHFYDIPWCLKNYLDGRRIVVTETIPIIHESGGFLDEGWAVGQRMMQEKFKYQFSAGPIAVEKRPEI